MPVNVYYGTQRGDEGKGRFVDEAAAESEAIARWGGGDNAGHTVVDENGVEYDLHGIPSGIAHPEVVNVIGNGVLVNAFNLPREMDEVAAKGITLTPDNLKISAGAHLILPHHISIDEIREGGSNAQGSTKSGIAPAASEKYFRSNLRMEDVVNDPNRVFNHIYERLMEQRHLRLEERLPNLDEEAVALAYVEKALLLGAFVTDTSQYLRSILKSGATVTAEGAQAFLLDIDHGMYENVTSSSTIASGAPAGLGIPVGSIDQVFGVAKAIQSHVGGGHFVTEIKKDENPELLRRLHGNMSALDAEKGTTTGRVRRLGYLDLPGIRRAQGINGDDAMLLTKMDWVPRFGDELQVCVAYEYNGEIIQEAPEGHQALTQCKPVLEPLPNWSEDIQHVRRFRHLPRNARNYVRFIEDITGVPIARIGVGPRRDQVIEL